MVSFEVSNNLMHTFVFTFSQLPRHPKNRVCTVFITPACAKFRNDKMCILGLKLVDALTIGWIGITFVEIERNLVIMWYKVDSFVYQSANFDPRIKILFFLNFSWSCVLKIVQNYLLRCLGSREIGKTEVRINLIETSIFPISNMVSSLHFCQ